MHTAAEEFIRDGKEIPPEFAYIKPTLEVLKEVPGDKYCEFKMGLRQDLTPCDFMAKDVWWRGIADLLVVNEEKGLAYSADYKTSKNARYADTKQLDLVAVGIFAHFPKIKRVKSALVFVVSKEFRSEEHTSELQSH